MDEKELICGVFFLVPRVFKECFIINFIQAHLFFSCFLFVSFFSCFPLFCHFITDRKKICYGEGKEQRKAEICGQLKEGERKSL